MSPDPMARAAFLISVNLFGALVKRELMTKAEALAVIDEVVAGMEDQAQPDEPVIELTRMLRQFIEGLIEPTRS